MGSRQNISPKQKAITEIISHLSEVETREEFEKLKYRICKSHKQNLMLNSDILNSIKNPSQRLKSLMRTKPVRTTAGVSVVSVMTKPTDCPHGKCIMCPRGEGSPQSYTGKEPATMRAITHKYNPQAQVKSRVEQLERVGHPTDKIEVIVMGGTFTSMPKSYTTKFIKGVFDGLNGKVSKTLQEAQKLNEKAKHRCVGLTIETRPDYCSKKDVDYLLGLGVTRVELGVQSVFDDVLQKMERGHGVKEIVEATKLLKDSAFKINYHVMTGLPGSNPERDLECFKKIFSDDEFKPDMLKIYPLMVISGTKIHKLWKKKLYKPYSEEELINLLVKVKSIVPFWIRIMRIQRDIPLTQSEAGVLKGNIREILEKRLNCKCIRCREIGRVFDKSRKFDSDSLSLKYTDYLASRGKEIFLQFSDKYDTLVGFLRLRLCEKAFVRELHVYGEEIPLGEKGSWQHTGVGKALLLEAERISKEEGFKEIFVISGVGVRPYYRRRGYKRKGFYMCKRL